MAAHDPSPAPARRRCSTASTAVGTLVLEASVDPLLTISPGGKITDVNGLGNAAVDSESVFLVIFRLAERLFALHLEAVERAVRVVDVTPLPGAPEIVLGAVDVEGRIVPVLNVCRRFGIPAREIELTDQLLLARCSSRTVALLVESVAGVARHPRSAIVRVDTVEPRTEYVEGILQLEDGMVLIHDLEKFLSLDEQHVIATAMADK